jgi:hypothetical protein
MKRDLDLVRDILLHFEKRESPSRLEVKELAAQLGRADVGLVAYHI